MRCIAVDDEPLALALLADNISKVPYLELKGCCSDAFEAMRVLETEEIDLIFIDIQMPGLTGLQFISSLKQKPMAILITAYKQYALHGYELSVVDYLLKPVDMARFIEACHKARELHGMRRAALEPQLKVAARQDYFFINVDYSLLKVAFKDIVWIEGLRDYVKIHLSSAPGKPLVARLSIRSLEEQLTAGAFIRIHKSYIIAIDSITAVRKSSVFIRDQEFTIGETYKDALRLLTGG